MLLSVIVPIYNTANYLKRCVDSILAQTYREIEIILVDDGSTDDSGRICDAYKEKYDQIKVYHIPNGGVSHARNVGLDNATGEFIAFVDSDDYIRPNMYETLLSIAREKNVDIVTSDMLISNNVVTNSLDKNVIYDEKKVQTEILPAFSHQNSIAIMAFTNKIFRFSAICDVRFYEGFSYQEDLMFMINIYAHIKSLYYIDEVFYEYVPMPTGLYSTYRKDAGEKFIEARKIILSLVRQYSIDIDILFFNNSFLYNICYYIYRTGNYVCDKKEKKELIGCVLDSDTVIDCCKWLSANASSFDKRISKAICSGKKKIALFLIELVYSGKADKLQRIVAKIKHRGIK